MKIIWMLDNINTMNGMVRVVIGLSNYFTEKGNEVEIVSFYSNRTTPFFSLRPDVRVRNLGKDWSKLTRSDKHQLLGDLMQTSDADIMLTCNEWANSSSVLHKRKFAGKLIVTQHMSCDGFTRRRRVLNAVLHRFADKVAVLTEADSAFYKKFGVQNVTVIPNAVYTETVDISNKQNIICAAGRFDHQKGFDLLIQAFAKVAEKMPDWKLRILGDGSQRANLLNQVNELGLSHQIEMPGMSNAIAEEFARSSIYVLSSRHEGFGLTLVEAMHAGNAIVAFDLPCVRDILTSESAIIVPPENAEALAAALYEMVCNTDFRVSSSLAAHAKAQEYTIENIGDKWLRLFDSLLGSNQ